MCELKAVVGARWSSYSFMKEAHKMFSGEFISVVVEFVSVGWEVVLFCEVLFFRLEEIMSVVVVFFEGREVLFVEVLMF